MTGLTFLDSVDANQLPSGSRAFAGYVDGRWPSLDGMRRRFPRGEWLSVATSSSSDAMVIDCESGDVTPAGAAAWCRRMHRKAYARPVVYCSLSVVPELERALAAARVLRSQIRLWTAHYTQVPHICSEACGVPMEERPGATQWGNNHPAGCDSSLTSEGWFSAVRSSYLHRSTA